MKIVIIFACFALVSGNPMFFGKTKGSSLFGGDNSQMSPVFLGGGDQGGAMFGGGQSGDIFGQLIKTKLKLLGSLLNKGGSGSGMSFGNQIGGPIVGPPPPTYPVPAPQQQIVTSNGNGCAQSGANLEVTDIRGPQETGESFGQNQIDIRGQQENGYQYGNQQSFGQSSANSQAFNGNPSPVQVTLQQAPMRYVLIPVPYASQEPVYFNSGNQQVQVPQAPTRVDTSSSASGSFSGQQISNNYQPQVPISTEVIEPQRPITTEFASTGSIIQEPSNQYLPSKPEILSNDISNNDATRNLFAY